MKEEIVWQAEGQLWESLSVIDDGSEWVIRFRNAVPSYIKDRDTRITRTVTLEQAIEFAIKNDLEYYEELTLQSEEL